MNIALIYTFYKGFQGGAKIHLDSLIDALSRRGHTISIITTRKQYHQPINCRVISLSPFLSILPEKILKLGTGITDRMMAHSINKVIALIKPDIIHVQDDYILPAVIKAKIQDIPIVASMHQPLELDDARKRSWFPGVAFLYKRRLKKNLACFQKVDRVIAVSKFIKNSFVRLKIRNEGVETIYNLLPSWKSYGGEIRDHNNTRLFTAGRLVKSKGFETLIRAMHLIANKYGDKSCKLIIAGEGPQEKQLKKLASDLPGQINFIGTVEHKEMKNLYRGCDVVVFPSEVPESFGLIAAEGMLSGKPVVASRIGAIPEIVEDGKTGILVPPGDEEALANAIYTLVRDVPLRKKMGIEGIKQINTKIDRNKIIRRHLDIYNGLSNNVRSRCT